MRSAVVFVGAVVVVCAGAGVLAAGGGLPDKDALRARAGAAGSPLGPDGPDVIVSRLGVGIGRNGTVDGITAYSIMTESCNLGDTWASWDVATPDHPLIAQNLFRISTAPEGYTRFEQIGMSWLKHSFCAADRPNQCGLCQPSTQCEWLGVGCRDPYGVVLNENQFYLGPRSEVNPWNGSYPYPFVLGWNQIGDDIYKRLQVHNTDLDPEVHPDAVLIAEAHYITTDEPAWLNHYNNASWRVVELGRFQQGGWNLAPTGPVVQEEHAIMAWGDHDASVSYSVADVMGTDGEPCDGRFILGHVVTDLGDGMWHYEYAVHNVHSDRAGGGFIVPVPPGATVENIGFHDVAYHSGEPFDGADWQAMEPAGRGSGDGAAVAWRTAPHAADVNANALRWGTTYTFRFDCDRAPQDGTVTIELFKPAGPDEPETMSLAALVPGGCAGDVNGDGAVNGADLSVLIGSFGSSVTPGTGGDLNGDGMVNGADLSVVIGGFGCATG